MLALPIVAFHVLGLPLGILVLIRLMAWTLDAVRALCRLALQRVAGATVVSEARPIQPQPEASGRPLQPARQAPT